MTSTAPRLLLSPERIAARLQELGAEITEYYAKRPEPLTVLTLMKGGLYFAADLTRQIAHPLQLEFLTASSYYNGTTSSGTLHCTGHAPDLTGRHLLLLDDILDTGLTLAAIQRKLLEESNALSLRTAVLLRKEKSPPIEVMAKADWIGFSIADEFVIGYGLDHAQEHRALPYIGVLEE